MATSPRRKQSAVKPRRIVSAAKGVARTTAVSFRLTHAERKKLDRLSASHHRSRSELIAMAVARCMADGIWVALPPRIAAATTDPSPAEELTRIGFMFHGAAMSLKLMAGDDESAYDRAHDLLDDCHAQAQALSPSPCARSVMTSLRGLLKGIDAYKLNRGPKTYKVADARLARTRLRLASLYAGLPCT